MRKIVLSEYYMHVTSNWVFGFCFWAQGRAEGDAVLSWSRLSPANSCVVGVEIWRPDTNIYISEIKGDMNMNNCVVNDALFLKWANFKLHRSSSRRANVSDSVCVLPSWILTSKEPVVHLYRSVHMYRYHTQCQSVHMYSYNTVCKCVHMYT